VSGAGEERPLLEVRDFAASFAGAEGGESARVRAVDGVDLTIYPGQTLAVVGESGCGKSVTALSMLQLVPRPPGRFDRGEILFESSAGRRDLLKLSEREIRAIRGNEIAMIFQEPMTSLNPVYTVGDQITEAIRLHQRVDGRRAEAIAIEAMREVGITRPEERLGAYPHEFSGGMRQRVMIAMALACKPRLLLADEPTTALDVTIQAQILELLRALQAEKGLAVMLITHALGVVAENADVVCVMYAGRVVEYARVYDLFDEPLHPYTRGLLASIPPAGGAGRVERLQTVSETVGREEEFGRLPGGLAERGVRPWWPGHARPAGMGDAGGTGRESVLCEVRPGHWVAVWATAGAIASGAGAKRPDLSFRRSRAAEARVG
jgi:ABC-type dipeptide/oligopeptide/nickel transport system ATPase component